ncbi:UNVERIFIED_CONTAM: hypothetical protein Slati_1482000 [Sesamum latifolium]|uniref:MULE transposase domain-containing protein n=1 Tax=Sesamum latifolium TaxID=2727402 RepID=A0AAW2X6K0_9LAMI
MMAGEYMLNVVLKDVNGELMPLSFQKNSTWLSGKYESSFRSDPKRNVKGFRNDVIKDIRVIVSKSQAYRAKHMELESIDVVNKENKDNWKWFLLLLRVDLSITREYEYTLISDKQKGLLQAFDSVFPTCENRFFVRHLHRNMKRAGFRGLAYKKAFWKCALASTMSEFEKRMKEMGKINKHGSGRPQLAQISGRRPSEPAANDPASLQPGEPAASDLASSRLANQRASDLRASFGSVRVRSFRLPSPGLGLGHGIGRRFSSWTPCYAELVDIGTSYPIRAMTVATASHNVICRQVHRRYVCHVMIGDGSSSWNSSSSLHTPTALDRACGEHIWDTVTSRPNPRYNHRVYVTTVIPQV